MNKESPGHGRVALVTGAARRVGRVIAQDLARQGYAIVVHYRTSRAEAEQFVLELENAGHLAFAVAADQRVEHEVVELFTAIDRTFGRIDVLVASAATFSRAAIFETSTATMRYEWESNVLGPFLLAREAGARMVHQSQGGTIILIGDWAVERPYPGYAAYFAGKGSIPTLTRTLAVEWASRHPSIRVNAVLPGPVLLPPDSSPDHAERLKQATLVKRLGTPEHVAHAVRFLIENDFVTGVCLPLDGGRTIFGGPGSFVSDG